MLLKKIATTAALTLAASTITTLGVGTGIQQASAQSCYRTVHVAGQNAFGYAKAYSWQDWSRIVRTAPTASLCINYARAYGGYYFAGASCGQSSARLTSDSTSYRGGSNQRLHLTRTSTACAASATWKWHRTVANDQCAHLLSQARWGIDQATGNVQRNLVLPSHDYFEPASC